MGKKVNSDFIDPITGLDTPRKQATYEGLDLTPLPSMPGMEPTVFAGDIIGERKRYDDNITLKDLDNLERERALHQPWEGKAFNAFVGGIASGVLTAAEDVGYILDFDNNIKRLKGLEEVDTNGFSAAMSQMKEGLYDAMPIHRQTQEVFDWTDPGFYWSSFRGILDSAVGFAIPGMAATKAVGLAQKGTKLAMSTLRGTKAVQRAARLDKYMSMLTASKPVQQMINAGASAYITNFGEGKMMAVEQFTNSVEEMKQALYEEKVLELQETNPDLDTNEALKIAAERTQSDLDSVQTSGKTKLEEFESIAGEQANRFMLRNKAFIVTDAIGLHGLYKGKGFTRSLLSEKGLKASAKRLGTLSSDNLLVQAGKEGAEEIGQNVLQMEGEYQALRKAGFDAGDVPEDFAERIYEFATSDQALLEGMMGLFGGGPQRIFTEVMTGNIGAGSRKAYSAKYEEQQAQMAANTEYMNTKLGNYAEFQAARAIALKNGQDNLDKLLRDKGFVNIATENFVRGTTEHLERSLKEIEAGVSEEQRLANGWDEDYQAQATEQLEELSRMERNYTRLTRFEDQAKIFKNRETRRLLDIDRQTLQDALDETTAEIEASEIPDQQLLDAQEYYENTLKSVKEKIIGEDRQYKRMTGAKYQNAKKAQDRKSARELRQSIFNAKNEAKANQSKKEAENTDQNIKVKEEVAGQAEVKEEGAEEEERRKKEDVGVEFVTEPEEEVTVFAGEEPAEITPTEEPAEGPEPGEIREGDIPLTTKTEAAAPKMSAEQKEAKQQAEDQIDDLFNNLLPPDEGVSAALVGAEGQTREQDNVGRIQNIIQSIGEASGNPNPTFDDLIAAIIGHVGVEKLARVFPTVERVYGLANLEYVVSNKTLNEYLQLTLEEKKFKRDKNDVDKRTNKGQYTNETDKQIDEDYVDIERTVRANNTKKKVFTDYLKVESGSGILAYLARVYDQVFKKGNVFSKEEVTNQLNANMTDPTINDPKKYGPGTKVRLVVEHDNDGLDVYHEDPALKQTTTWGEKKEMWKNDPKMDEDTRKKKYNEQVPIAVFSGDQKIGYLHEVPWISELNVSGDVEADRQRSRDIRNHIVAEGEFETTVINKTDGYLSKSSDGHHITADAMPQKDLQIVVATDDGKLERTKTKGIDQTDLVNKTDKTPFRKGVAYLIVPIKENKKIAIPLKSRKIGDNEAVVRTITRALGIFYFGRDDKASQDIVDSIMKETGFNINEADGISDFMQLFFNNYKIGEGFENFEDYMARPNSSEKTEDAYVHMTKYTLRPGENDMRFDISRGKGAEHVFMNKRDLERMGPETFEDFIATLTDNLNRVFAHVDLNTLGQGKKIALINENDEVSGMAYEEYVKTMTTTPFLSHDVASEEEKKAGKHNYVYTIQPVVSMDFSKIDKVDPKKTAENKLFRDYVRESQHPDTTEERKMELDILIAEMYYAEDELITHEEQRRQTEEKKKTAHIDPETGNVVQKDKQSPTIKKRRPRKGGLNFQDNQEIDPESGAKVPMTEQGRDDMEAASEVKLEDGEVTGTIISEIGVRPQQSMVSHIRGRALDIIFRSKKAVDRKEMYARLQKEIVGDDLEAAKLDLADAIEEGDAHEIQVREREVAQYEIFDKNWNKLAALTTESLDRIGGIRLIRKDLEQEAEEGITEEQAEQQKEGANWSDVKAFVTNPADGIAPKVKQFLSGITEVRRDDDGNIVPMVDPYIGANKIMDYQRVYELIQRLTPNIRPNYDQMIASLEEYITPFPFLEEVITKLNGADQQIKNQFVSGLTNHYVNMRFIMFSQDSETKAFSLVEHESDANALARVIQGNWYRNLIQSTNSGFVAEAPDEYVILKDVKDKLAEQYDDWIANLKGKQKVFPPEAEMRQWLESFGIVLADDTFNTLMTGEFVYRGYKQSLYALLTSSNGIFKILSDKVTGPGAVPIVSGKLLDDTVIKDLALEDSKNQLNNFTNSHRSGSKTVYSFGQNKFFINRLRDLKLLDEETGENGLLRELSTMPFSGVSAWVDALMEKVPEGEQNAFRENLGYWVASLEPLKKKGAKSRDNTEMHNLSEAEIEVIKIGMLQSAYKDVSGNNQRVVQILYPTTSDKTTVVGLRIIAQDILLTKEGDLEQVSVDKLIEFIVRPEMRRIKAYQDQKRLDTEDDRHTIDNKEYADGAEQFLFFPTLNTLPGLFLANGDIDPNFDTSILIHENLRLEVRRYFEHLVNEKLDNWAENDIGVRGQRLLDSKFMRGDTAGRKNPLRGRVSSASRVRGAASDMVFQYLIGNAEIAKVFTGDPAMYFKVAEENKTSTGARKSKYNEDGSINLDYNFVADAEETYINIGKRLAGDIAPGYEIAESSNDAENHYTQAFIADVKTASLAALQLTKLLDGKEATDMVEPLLEKLNNGDITQRTFFSELRGIEKLLKKKLVSAPYYAIDAADAQEYTTWQEHLYVMRQSGEISDDFYKEAFDALSTGNDINPKVLAKIMQPMKPVYVDNIIDDKSGFERRVYIKSSSFPLLPQLTRGTDLENLRLAMERDNISRVAYSTAVKVGNVTEPFNIFDDNGRIMSPDQLTFKNSTLMLNRKGFRIQQKVPYDFEKFEINKVTQASKNLFINMLKVKGFEFEGKKDWTGEQLQKRYHDIYNELHQLEKEALLEEITVDGDPDNIDVDNLRSLLLQEVKERSYPISDRELLIIDKELRSLAFAPSAHKYEALLNSIVTNKIVKLKFPGKSYVLGSEEGFINRLTPDEATGRFEDSGIVFTDRWDGETGLKPAREDASGKRLPAQAIVPWKFRDKEGNILKMSDFTTEINGRIMIDREKLPQNVRELFGMRIPNQGPNSQSWVEIVGFLPEASGDLFIATKDYVVQMGSDFDVDKIYTYMYNTYVDSAGTLKPHDDLETEKKATLQNKILDIHIAVHKNPDPKVQEQIANPLGFWKLKDISTEISNLRRDREVAETQVDKNKKLFTGLSDKYQRDKFKNAAAGKIGVGVFSQDSMLNAVAQGKDLVYTQGKKRVPITVKFGDTDKTVSKGKMSDELALDGETYKSDIIAGYQSGAVDNEKEQILDKINVNKHTFSVIKLLNQLGFSDEVPYFLSQDIIIDYVRTLERLNSSTSDFYGNRETEATRIVREMDKYKIEGEDIEKVDPDGRLANEEATTEKLREYIEKGDKATNYRAAQVQLLIKFKNLSEMGKEIQKLQGAINADSAGLGKSVLESQIKENQVFSLYESPIKGATKLLGDFKRISPGTEDKYPESKGWIIRDNKRYRYAIRPTTINGQAVVHGLFTNNRLWSKFFYYQNDAVVGLMGKIEELSTQSSDVTTKIRSERQLELWKEMKSFIFTDPELEFFDKAIQDERERLVYDRFEYREFEEAGVLKTEEIPITKEESLASALIRFKNTKLGRENNFLQLLEIEYQKNGDPSLITYRASTAEGSDETEIYAAFTDAFTNKTGPKGGSPVIGTFQGESYTLRQLAEDLVSYTYINGGIQEALQFVKYVPAAYLTTLPFMKYLSDASLTIANMDPAQLADEENEYYNISPFVEQYFQHHPEEVRAANVREDLYKGRIDAQTRSFKLNEKGFNKLSTVIANKLYPPPYLRVNSKVTTRNAKLFKYNPADGTYYEIDVLGKLGASEYDYTAKFQSPSLKSKIRRNNVVTPVDPVKPIGTTPEYGPVDEGDFDLSLLEGQADELVEERDPTTGTVDNDPLMDRLINGEQETTTFKDGIEKSKAVLNNIIQTGTSGYNKVLAQEIFDNMDKLPTSMIIRIGDHGVDAATWRYIYEETIDPAHTMTISRNKIAGMDETDANSVFMHELLHGLTGYKLLQYVHENKKDEKSVGIMEKLRADPNFRELNDRERKASQEIESLMAQAKKKMFSDPIQKAEYDQFMQDLILQNGLDASTINKFYGFTDIKEFVSVALTNPDFQRILDNTQYKKETSFWEALKERLGRLLKALGFEFTEGSILQHTIYETLNLVTDRFDEYITEADIPSEVNPINFGNLTSSSVAPVNPQRIVSDDDVNDLMKHCKGI